MVLTRAVVHPSRFIDHASILSEFRPPYLSVKEDEIISHHAVVEHLERPRHEFGFVSLASLESSQMLLPERFQEFDIIGDSVLILLQHSQ